MNAVLQRHFGQLLHIHCVEFSIGRERLKSDQHEKSSNDLGDDLHCRQCRTAEYRWYSHQPLGLFED